MSDILVLGLDWTDDDEGSVTLQVTGDLALRVAELLGHPARRKTQCFVTFTFGGLTYDDCIERITDTSRGLSDQPEFFTS